MRKLPYQVTISIGQRYTQSDLPPIPQNIIVKNHIPQLEVLQKADLFISHAGMNSTNESLYYGVPLLTIPQMYEQTVNAIRIEQLGAGIVLKKENVTEKTVLTMVERVVQTKSFYTSAATIQKTLIDAGGYKKATLEIMNYIRNFDLEKRLR